MKPLNLGWKRKKVTYNHQNYSRSRGAQNEHPFLLFCGYLEQLVEIEIGSSVDEAN